MKWAVNDLKANRGIWAGVFLVLVMTQTILCAMSVGMGITGYYSGLSNKTSDPAKHLASGFSLVYATTIILGCLVIMQTLQASIRQRRQGLALLSLLGATPRQVLFYTMVQVLVLTFLSSGIGVMFAPLIATRMLDFYIASLQISVPLPFTWHNFPRSALTGLTIGLLMAIVATRLTLRQLEKTIPIQVLGRATGEQTPAHANSVWGAILFIASLMILLMPLFVSLHISHNNLEALSKGQIADVINVTGAAPLLAILLLLIALARAGGPVIGWATRVWTSLVPSSSAVWRIARSQAVVRSRGKAFGSTIIALTCCILLIGGLLTAGQTSTAAMHKIPGFESITTGGPREILSGFWTALLIAIVGAVASFAISAKERNLDLALVSIAGASPEQLLLISALDGFILMMTGILLAAAATLLVGAATSLAYMPFAHGISLVYPWQVFLVLGVPILAIGSLATFVTAHSTLKQPAIQTIQASIGE